ncbi:phytoene/squalene synthase family protein [Mangrovicella endophytica]|uniref:phytoene/squalene synthase family protein n=1 Tax=Mangrovicella endophytica TaxID=2066697 RepID=UPI000C9E8D32|nr:phytoene/squalene synthase family protein [Mangrovicella endophytica]
MPDKAEDRAYVEAAAECERLVREGDPDRAVTLAFVPAEHRPYLAALYAFNIETARVRAAVSQPLPGEIRLQWWRDRLAGTEAAVEGSTGNPVADLLDVAIRRFDLPRDAFDRFIEARIFDLYDDPMPDRGAFEAYAGSTASALIVLAAMILDRKLAPQVVDAAGHAGVAQAAVGAIRLLPIHRRLGHVLIPADILAVSGSTPETLLAGEAEASTRAIAAMTAFAREHFEAYRVRRASIPASLRAAFLPAALTGAYLDRIERAGATNLEQPAPLGPLRRAAVLWRAMRR